MSCHVLVSLLTLLIVVIHVDARPVDPIHNDENLSTAMMYLLRFGYMDSDGIHGSRSASIMSRDGIKKYVMEFQKFVGLNQTGDLDSETMTWMHKPRCGVKDVIGKGNKINSKLRGKRFVVQGSRWKVKTISYKISNYPTNTKMSNEQVDAEIRKAFDVWSDHTDLRFERLTSGQVHIDIRFEKGEHGDGDAFDGPGGTLAHAFFPVYGGDAHFDDSETWSANSYVDRNLLQTAAHEFGHSLGLSHSDVTPALMAPFYNGFEVMLKLQPDDVKAIQALYGKSDDTSDNSNEVATDTSVTSKKSKSQPKPKTAPTPSPAGNPDPLCRNSSFDAIIQGHRNRIYVFKGAQYWQLENDNIVEGFPRNIEDDWDELPPYIDAAFNLNNKTYFFKDTQYWRFTNMKKDSGFPKPINLGFEGIPAYLDAAFVWTGNGKIYFFKGSKFYKFDPKKRPPVGPGYPKPISNWEGIPNHLDAAAQIGDVSYFFKDGKYWRFDDEKYKVKESNPGYPRSTAQWWFGCNT